MTETLGSVPVARVSLLYSLCCALVLGVSTTIIATVVYTNQAFGVADFAWPLQGIRMILRGGDPYSSAFHIITQYDQDAPLYYPLPALLLLAPLAPLPDSWAGGLFIGGSSALLAFVVLRQRGWAGLLIFTSVFYVYAIRWCQWSPLVLAAALWPWAMPGVLCKPSLGLVAFAYAPSWRAILSCGLLIMLSLIVLPTWIVGWLHNVATNRHAIPLLILPAPLVILAGLRWRDGGARALLLLALVPQRLQFPDQLLIFLVAGEWRRMLTLVLGGWCAWLCWQHFNLLPIVWQLNYNPGSIELPGFWLVVFVFLPALGIVLERHPMQHN